MGLLTFGGTAARRLQPEAGAIHIDVFAED
jgi:hypothetical protein